MLLGSKILALLLLISGRHVYRNDVLGVQKLAGFPKITPSLLDKLVALSVSGFAVSRWTTHLACEWSRCCSIFARDHAVGRVRVFNFPLLRVHHRAISDRVAAISALFARLDTLGSNDNGTFSGVVQA